MKKTEKIRRIVVVTWWDAVSDTGWKDVDEIADIIKDGSHLAYSVGVIVRKDTHFIYLAADWGKSESFNRTIVIHRKDVRSIKTIHIWR